MSIPPEKNEQKKIYFFRVYNIYLTKPNGQKHERTILQMKGILSVIATVAAAAILVPLVLTNAYYNGENAPISGDILSTDKQNETDSVIDADCGDRVCEVPETPENGDEIIFEYDEDDSFALSPLFHLQVLDSYKNETSQDTEDGEAFEDERVPEEVEKLPNFTVSLSPGAESSDDEKNLRVYMHRTKTYETMSMTEYLYGVVAAEMPSYFDDEALKAQAIACRTYALYKMINNSFNSSSHGKNGAHICTNSGHCQAFISREEAESKWGKAYADKIFEAVCPAVDATKGQVMLYEGEPIFSAFHSMSYKFTDDVENVWGGDYPYLKSVSSPEDSSFDGAVKTETFTSAKFKKYVCAESSKVSLSEDPANWVTNVVLNKSGRVNSLTIGGVEFTGREIQAVFSLAAANYSIKYDAENDEFVFTVRGRGHGIGMSQYGANLLAKDGYTYAEILCHYYTDVTIGSYKIG